MYNQQVVTEKTELQFLETLKTYVATSEKLSAWNINNQNLAQHTVAQKAQKVTINSFLTYVLRP